MLDLARLENVRHRGGKVIARCPACAEAGADRAGEHLVILEAGAGRFGCIANPGPEGHAHRQRIAELAGTKAEPAPMRRTAPKPKAAKLRPLTLELRTPSITALATIATSRGWPYFAGLQIAADRGLLHVGDLRDGPATAAAWVLTDSSRSAAQARRLDGSPWRSIGNKKAKTLAGSSASWPVGAADIGDRSVVMLCEGAPDCLAVLTVAWLLGAAADVAPVAMLGAGQAIREDAIPFFRGKHVRIIEQNDRAARRAGRKWYEQLRSVAGVIDGWEPPAEDKDISDTFTRLSREHEDSNDLTRALRRTGIMDSINQGGRADVG